MSNIKLWGWDKKPRTMIRYIKPGDLFAFRLDESIFMFGRIITKMDLGDVAEIFNHTSNDAIISPKDIEGAKRAIPPILLDSYSLFDKKFWNSKDAEWRIIGHQENYVPSDLEGFFFTYGEGSSCKKVDVFDNETPITEKESQLYPFLSPSGDVKVKEWLSGERKR